MSLRDLWSAIKCTNICIMGVPEGEEKEKRTERIFEEITLKNSPKLMKDMNLHIQEAQQIPRKVYSKRSTPGQIIIKLSKSKVKERILKTREKQLIVHKGSSVRLKTNFSSETMEARRQ